MGVLTRGDRVLVIERSQFVRAPGMLCFPGGGVEAGESDAAAVVREFQEELGLVVTAERALWRYTTSWRVDLTWWSVAAAPTAHPRPNPHEVAAVYWLTIAEALAHERLLESNRHFLAAWLAGEIPAPLPGRSS